MQSKIDSRQGPPRPIVGPPSGSDAPHAAESATPGPKPQLSQAEFWLELTRVASDNRRLRTILESVAFVSIVGQELTLAVTPVLLPVARGGMKDIEAIAGKVGGQPVRVVLQSGGTTAATADAAGSAITPPKAQGSAADPPRGPDIRQHPLVKQAEELFGARVVKVQQTAEGRSEHG